MYAVERYDSIKTIHGAYDYGADVVEETAQSLVEWLYEMATGVSLCIGHIHTVRGIMHLLASGKYELGLVTPDLFRLDLVEPHELLPSIIVLDDDSVSYCWEDEEGDFVSGPWGPSIIDIYVTARGERVGSMLSWEGSDSPNRTGGHLHTAGGFWCDSIVPGESVYLCEEVDGKRTWEERWYSNGVLHRADGPAVTLADGTQEWWYRGVRAEPVVS